jgi:dihydrofolate reductase
VVRGEVEELKLRAGEDLVVGGGDLAAAFMGQDLIDEHRIYVHPIQIGEGECLFPASKEKVLLRLAETRRWREKVGGSSGRIRTYNPPVNSRMLYP